MGVFVEIFVVMLPLALLAHETQGLRCWIVQEPDPDSHNHYRWVIPVRDPCTCTEVRVGGLTHHTPCRPFKVTYYDTFLYSSNPVEIRKFLGCNEPVRFGDFDLRFPQASTSNYVLMEGALSELNALTLSFWMRTTDQVNHGTPFSYATRGPDGLLEDNAFTIFDYNSLEIILNENALKTYQELNSDYDWHHVAVTWDSTDGHWAIYVDGSLRRSGDGFMTGAFILGSGALVLGQEQDSFAGGFDEHQSFVGDLSQVNMWNYAMAQEEISVISLSCAVAGNVLAWSQVRSSIHGNVSVIQSSELCADQCSHKPCSNGGTCQAHGSTFECLCPSDFIGERCQGPCASNPCQNNGICQSYSDPYYYSCECLLHYRGHNCETHVPCGPNPCENGGKCHPNVTAGTYYCEYYGSCQAIVDAVTFNNEKGFYYIKPVCDDTTTDPIQVFCRKEEYGWMRLFLSHTSCGTQPSPFEWTRDRIACPGTYLGGVKLSQWSSKSSHWTLSDAFCSSLTISDLDFFVDVANCLKPSDWPNGGVLVEGVCSTANNWGDFLPTACGSALNVHVNISVIFDASINNYGKYVLSCLNADSGEWIDHEWPKNRMQLWIKNQVTHIGNANP